MSATLKNLMLLVILVLALAGGYWTAQTLRPAENLTTPTYGGGTMIDFTLPDLDGKKQALQQWRGKVIVLNFWATWCPPCREEIPFFIALQKKHQADDLQIVGVAIDNLSAVMAYRQSVRMNYPILVGDEDVLSLVAQYGNPQGSLPYTVIIDRSGSIAVRKLGAFSPTELESVIDPLLKPQKI